jgi:hypothetical protein
MDAPKGATPSGQMLHKGHTYYITNDKELQCPVRIEGYVIVLLVDCRTICGNEV